ncbi:MAG TPA: DUF2723 domain-containing protein [bacterium]|nr:DUF2723 domain-containing protein [bacterium]
MLPVIVFAASLGLYLATLPRSVLPGDSGELIAASYTLSIAHPPGFPLYVILGKLLSSIFAFGSVAYRYNLFSAVVGAVTAALMVLVLARLGVRRLIAAAIALGLATLEAYWLQATTGDVYTLNGLFTALLLYVALAGRYDGERALPLVGFLGGLAISHHLTLVYGLASALVVLLAGMRRLPSAKSVFLSVFLFALGLTIWLYIPIRANLKPPLTWGETQTFSGFLSHVGAQSYRWRLRPFDFKNRLVDWLRYYKMLARESGGPLIVLACLGIVLNAKRLRLVGGCLLLVLLYSLHYVVYDIPDIESHTFPALLGVAGLAGMGLQRISTWRHLRRIGQVVAAGLALAIIIPNLVAMHPRKDEWFASDLARAVEASAIKACGKDCIIICTGDVSFPLLYNSFAGVSSAREFYPGLSDPGTIGVKEHPTAVDGWVNAVGKEYGVSRVALFGAAPPSLMGQPTQICGLIRAVCQDSAGCGSPLDYPVRGVGEDLRDYASRYLSWQYYLHLARWRIQEGDRSGAQGYVGKALEAAYDDITAYLDAASIYRNIGMGAEARRLLDRALKLDPDFFEIHNMLGGMALDAGRADEAAARYRRALRGNPHPAPMYSNLGNADLARGDYPSALADFRTALSMDSTLINAYVGLGRTFEGQGDLDRALAYYQLARHRDSASEPASHAAAALLIRMERYGDARQVIEAGLALAPRSALLLSDLGLVNLREDDLDSAIAHLGEALAIDPSMLAVRGNLAVAYEAKGMKPEAAEQYRIYLKTAPPGQARNRALEALNRLTSG